MDEEIKIITIDEIIRKAKILNKTTDSDIIIKAYEYSKDHHNKQLRKSGENYIIHPLQVAYVIADLGLDDEAICAALLHDVVEDTNVTKEEIEKEFGSQIAEMVEGVTKLRKTAIYYRKRTTS